MCAGPSDHSLACRCFLSEFYLDVSLRCYAEADALRHEGGLILRPWMLNFGAEYGLKGHIEPAPN